eukprot:gene3460-3956_t
MTTEEANIVQNDNEPSMFLQRPSSSRCQDISHVLTRIFRDVYTNDAVHQDTVKYLTTSRSGKSGYHDEYVENLKQIQEQWEEKIKIANEIEEHLIHAHSEARKSEVVEEQLSLDRITNYNDLGLPSVPSQLASYLDAEILRNHNLIVPKDFLDDKTQTPKSEYDERTPQYARPTTSSMQRYRKTPEEDNYHSEKPIKQFNIATETSADILKIDHDKNGRSLKTVDKAVMKKEKANALDEKQIWRDEMKPEQRMVERKDLEKLQKKSNYLKNPRFHPLKPSYEKKQILKETPSDRNSKELEKNNIQDIFQPWPDPVIFTNYHAREVYELTFSLKNLTSSSRQVRVLPPLTKFFSIGLGKFPTTDGNLIAPGMSCQYCIRFAPDSLADYDDTLKVETTFAEPLLIPIRAHRPPPNLTLSRSFNCGHCLVNGSKSVRFNCTNLGGEGRFCVISKDEWPTTNWKHTEESPGTVNIGSFILKPAMFHLKANESIDIEVIFSPTSVKLCEEEVVIVCDNCNTRSFVIEGVSETAGVELVSVENGLSDYHLSEMKDHEAQYLVRFERQYPHTFKQKEMIIRNTTAVELEFYWHIDRPVFNNMNKGEVDFDEFVSTIARQSSFEINPNRGTLAPSETSSFQIIFNPIKPSDYHNVARLILRNVPSFNKTHSKYSDVVSTQIELKGYTKLFDVHVEPTAIFFEDDCLINTPYEKAITIHNESDEEITFQWPDIENEHDDFSVKIVPSKAIIGAQEFLQCIATMVGKVPGRIQKIISCNIDHLVSPAFFQIESNFVGPTVRFTEPILNFGLVRHFENQVREIELKNYSTIPAAWKFKDDLTEYHRSINLCPSSGCIEGNSSETITVYLNADFTCMLEKILEFTVDNGHSCFIEARAVIQRPKVCILNSLLAIDECYINVPVIKKIYLQNMTLFSVDYQWNKIIGNDRDCSSINFQPSSGMLRPREKLEVEIVFNFSKETEIVDLFAVCEIKDMEHPLILSVKAKVNGLKVEYITPDVSGAPTSWENDAKRELKIEFGYDVAMELNPKTVLIIKNHSAITAPFSLHVENFQSARMPSPPNQNKSKNNESKSRSGRALLGKTSNSIGHLSKNPAKAFEDHCNGILANGKGVAFVAEPCQGQLRPFEQIVVEITAYCNMWGEYNDSLLCSIGNLDLVKIPMHIETTGCPLNFQISKEQSPILRFGSHISGGETCNRSLKINNNSPCDIRVDWQSFIMDQRDNQILDLLVMIGDPFPKRDENDEEIEDEDCILDPLIKVKLNPHQGNKADIPFQMKPRQLIVPAKGSSHVVANFIPTANQKRKIDVLGYALGFMSISKKDSFSDHLLRCDGIDVMPFHLNFTADIKPPKLLIQSELEDGFHFIIQASDLLIKNDEFFFNDVWPTDSDQGFFFQIGEIAVLNRRFVTSNISGTNLQFSMSVEEPFKIALNEDSRDKSVDESVSLNLKPDCNFEVKIMFMLSHSFLLSHLSNANEQLRDGINGAEHLITKNVTNLHLTKTLMLHYSNGTSQPHNLDATIHLPVLELSQQILNFETCLVGQTREQYVTIKNIGKSRAYWTAEFDKCNPEASKSAFSISPNSGLLQADLNYNVQNTEIIKVCFKARHNIEYECKVLLKNILTENTLVLILKGIGSYDQISEKIVNVLT